jgi:hypothetical protein
MGDINCECQMIKGNHECHLGGIGALGRTRKWSASFCLEANRMDFISNVKFLVMYRNF